jgi:hypothetical protein
MNRRGFILGAGALLAAPAIVKYANIMPVRNRLYVPYTFSCYIKHEAGTGQWINLMPYLTGSDKLEPCGNGWFRWSTTREVKTGGGKMIVKLPSDGPIWGFQCEFKDPGLLVSPGEHYDVAIQGPSGGSPHWLTGDGPGCVSARAVLKEMP